MSHQYMTEQEMRAAEQRCQQATSGEWRVRPLEFDDWGLVRAPDASIVASARSGRHVPFEEMNECRKTGTDPYEDNAQFIAHAHQDLPRTLADLRELRRVVREQSQKLDKVATWLERNAQKLEESAKNNRFKSLAEAELADARNYRATAKDIRVTLALAQQVEGGK